MKKQNKIFAIIVSLSLFAIQSVQPAHAAAANSMKYALTETAKANINQSSQNKPVWDKSTLSFTGQAINSNGISATIKNGGSPMQGDVVYEVYRSEKGNPKDGVIVASGVVKALLAGEPQELSYSPDLLEAGNYIFKAYQRPNHPGTGVLWSSAITVKESITIHQQLQPVRPFDQFFNSSVEGGTATFTIPEGMGKVEISFSSYVYPEGVVPQQDGEPYESQTLYDNVTKTYGPGTYTVHVDLPENGYWQTDLYLGPVIDTLTESGHPLDKIIDADFGSAN